MLRKSFAFSCAMLLVFACASAEDAENLGSSESESNAAYRTLTPGVYQSLVLDDDVGSLSPTEKQAYNAQSGFRFEMPSDGPAQILITGFHTAPDQSTGYYAHIVVQVYKEAGMTFLDAADATKVEWDAQHLSARVSLTYDEVLPKGHYVVRVGAPRSKPLTNVRIVKDPPASYDAGSAADGDASAPACRDIDESCGSNAQCCIGHCKADTKKCVDYETGWPGTACVHSRQCIYSTCQSGRCRGPLGQGTACHYNHECDPAFVCKEGRCREGVRKPGPAECSKLRGSCSFNKPCCQGEGYCVSGRCRF